MLTDSQRIALATRLRRGRADEPARIPRRPADLAELPLSPAQEQLWFLHRLAPGLPAYNVPLALALSGPLDRAALGRAIDALVARHEALRTRLVTGSGGRPAQVIDPPTAMPLPLTADLSALRPHEREVRLGELLAAEAIRPFTLSADALLRARLLRLGGDEHLLLLVVHHAVFDGWSARVLLGDLAVLYEQEASGGPAALDELPVQFADYAVWERGRLGEPAASRLADYWRATLAGLQTLSFPADRQRPVTDGFDGAIATRLTDPELLEGVRELSRREGTTPLVTIMAGLAALAYRYTGQADVTIGTVSASRARPELAPVIGFLVNTLPIRTDLSGDPSFREVVARVSQAATGAYAHQDLPFAQIVQASGVERDPGRTPLFQIALSYAERDPIGVRAAGVDFVVSDLVVGVEAAKFDLDFLAEARSGGLWFECVYKTALFDSATVQRLLGNLETLLRGAVADPSARISALPILTEAELHSELTEWNQAAGPIPPACVHELFGAQALRTPEAVAAEYGDEQVSYATLNRQASQIARRLRRAGVGPDDLVGVCMQAGLRRLAAFLGIWKAGGGYVPLDPALPASRLSFMISDAALPVVITDRAGAAAIPAGGPATTLSLDASWTEIAELDDGDLTSADSGVTPRNVAYVIYTSGSTGQPKGVVVEHRQAASFLRAMVGRWKVGPPDAVLQFASVSFDASVQEMFMPLIAGARVVLAPARTLHSPRRLSALMRDRGVTFAVLTPAIVSLLADEQFPDLRVLMCGGEAMPAELVGPWLRPGLRFVNDYGPTETTVTATVMELDATTPLPPPIGRPIAGWRAYV
ncbi:MAG TPA: condensation domain-containing protein, partial [Streptosporangiaceae bacterium]